MICALATGYLSDNSRVKQDTVMGVVFSGMFGVGIVLYTSIHTDVHLDHILFGNMLGVAARRPLDLGLIALVVSGVAAAQMEGFPAARLRPAAGPGHRACAIRLLHYGLLAILSLTIVATLNSVGLILAVALLVTPGAIAFLLTRRFGRMLAVAVAVALPGLVPRHLSELLPRQRAGADHRAGVDDLLHRCLHLDQPPDATRIRIGENEAGHTGLKQERRCG